MTFDQAVQLAREFGFPTLVAGWLLWRIDPAIRRLTAAVEALTTAVKEGRT